jgi:tRNA(Ile2) C34 agmatinyltransferase TiaS
MEKKAVKGRFKKGEGGRPVGAKNVINKTVKETVLDVFNRLQSGPNSLEAWAQEEPTEFYKIASKLIPTEVTGTVKQTIIVSRKKQDADGSNS